MMSNIDPQPEAPLEPGNPVSIPNASLGSPQESIPFASVLSLGVGTRTPPGVLLPMAIVGIVLGAIGGLISLGTVFDIFFLPSLSAVSATSGPTASTTATQGTPSYSPLTTQQANQVLNSAQTVLGNTMTPAQVKTLIAELQKPNQQLLDPNYSWSGVASGVRSPDGSVVLTFQSGTAHNFGGATLFLTPQGAATISPTQLFAPGFPTFHWSPSLVYSAAAAFGINAICSMFLLIASIMLTARAKSARKCMLIYAGIKLPLVLLCTALAGELILNVTSPPPGIATGPLLVFLLLFCLLPLVYPAVVWFVMKSRRVTEYYKQLSPAVTHPVA